MLPEKNKLFHSNHSNNNFDAVANPSAGNFHICPVDLKNQKARCETMLLLLIHFLEPFEG